MSIGNNRRLTRRDFWRPRRVGGGLYYWRRDVRRNRWPRQKKIPVGLQLYSVRDAEKDLPGVIKAVANMGYEGVEFAGYYNHKAPDFRKMLDDNGLVCCGTHTQYDTLKPDKFDETVAFNRTLGNKYIIVPWLDPNTNTTKEQWVKLAREFTDLSVKLKPHGMRIGYHSHGGDFKKIDGQTYWDILFTNARKDEEDVPVGHPLHQRPQGCHHADRHRQLLRRRRRPDRVPAELSRPGRDRASEGIPQNKNAILAKATSTGKPFFRCGTSAGPSGTSSRKKGRLPPVKAVGCA
jgi:hypothetical protein